MSINSIIRTAVLPIVPICEPHLYDGTATEYCTFNYTRYPDDFADDSPRAIGHSVQLHYCLPLNQNPNTKLNQLADALFAAGFVYPNIVDATDDVGQHYVLETEYTEVRA